MEKDVFAEVEYEFTAPLRVYDRETKTIRLASELIAESRAADPVRQKFYDMRGLASDNPAYWSDTRLFYKQAKFMEDFTDDYDGQAEVSMYSPSYQRMGYERLRTYFTWRTKIRQGLFTPACLSYRFLYVYELLMCIGARDPSDALDKLMTLWREWRPDSPELNECFPEWLKDFHIYYELPHSFGEFLQKYQLHDFYGEMFLFDLDEENCLDLWNKISGYDITASKFYNAFEKNAALMKKAFCAALRGLGQLRGLFLRTSSLTVPWIPFRRAQFHPWLRQADRTVELPGGEKFFCRDNKWETYYSAPQSFRKELSGFLIKKTEACVREAVGYKPGLTVNASAINKARHFLLEHKTFPQQLNNAIENAVGNFFEKQNRVVVTVDTKNLKRIREEAHGTAEKLIVPEASPCGKPPSRGQSRLHANEPLDDISKPDTVPDDTESSSSSSPVSIWATLREALTETERHALSKLLENGPDAFKTFASSHGIMPEVLADGINEKAMDIIGDNILDFTDIPEIYDDYKDNIEIVHNPGLVSSGQSKEYKFLIEIIPSL